jgi:ADP-ribose pyrophosphatase
MSVVKPWRRLSSEQVLQAQVFAVRRDKVALPTDEAQVIDYTRLEQPNSVLVVPLRDAMRVVMVEQYRYPIGASSLEFPAGSLEGDEAPEAAARRELKEELGVTASELRPLGAFYQMVNVSNVKVFVFLARDLEQGETHREATEQLVRHDVPLANIDRLIGEGRICDATTIASYFLAKRALAAP